MRIRIRMTSLGRAPNGSKQLSETQRHTMALQTHPESVRAEPGPSSSKEQESSGAWWSSWLASAKEKSMTALNATKRDLAEFVTVLSSDTKAAVSGASANINKILGQPASSNQTESGEGSPSLAGQKKGNTVEAPSAPYDRCQAQLFAVQNSKDTYLVDPEDKVYAEWKSKFDIQACQSDISTILVCCSHVRTLHSQLVPAQVSYEAFWMRYFYKVQQLQKEEKRRAELMERAAKRTEEQLQWDEELEEITASELSPPLLKPEGGHQRSESSSDSFVCISEATSNNDTHIDRASQDPDTWVYLGSENGHSGQHSPQYKEEERAKLVAEIQHLTLSDDLDEETLEASDRGGGGVGEQGEKDVGKRKDREGEGRGGGGDSGSDWENWDD